MTDTTIVVMVSVSVTSFVVGYVIIGPWLYKKLFKRESRT